MERFFLVVISTLINHDKDFIYQSRGYNSVHEMNEDIVNTCNSYIDDDDDFYILGDCIMGKDVNAGIALMQKLHGCKHIIIGNHDTNNRIAELCKLPNIGVLGEAKTIKYKKTTLFLCHYPTKFSPIGPYYRTDRLCLCGHTHTKDPWLDIMLGSFHVEWDAWHRPIEITEIMSLMKEFNRVLKEELA